MGAIVNAPLPFTLQHLDPHHLYLMGRGFTPNTIAHFGLGYCARGLLKDRIAIPMHDATGALVAYAGRIVDDNLIDENTPRYRFPGTRNVDGVPHAFRKSMLLYNAHTIPKPVDELIVVEGFTGAWWLHQLGLTNVVAVMGSGCSDAQGELVTSLVRPDGRVIVMPDGDDAGRQCAVSLFAKVASRRCVRWACLPDGAQPTDLTREQLVQSVG